MENQENLCKMSSDGIDRSAMAKKPIFTSEQENSILNALKYAAETQRIYLQLMEEAEEKKEAPAPSPYPAYSLAPTFSTTSSTTISTVSNPFPNLPPSLTNTSSSTNVLQLHNLSILSRVYVGSINFELTEADLKAAFSVFGPVKSISLSIDPITQHHKGYCFIEFETPEAAALALETMNGSELGGRSIKVGRSNNFPTDLPPGIPRPYNYRIYVSNIHDCVTENDVKDIFASFGAVRACSLIPDTANRCHKGYGYVEFEEEGPAMTSMIALRNFNLGGLELKIGKTIVGGDMPLGMSILERLPSHRGKKALPTAVLDAAKSINQIINMSSGANAEMSTSQTTTNTSSLPQSTTAKPSGPGVMLLTNMIMASELDDEVQEEVAEECKKYGNVLHVKPIISSTQSPKAIRNNSSQQIGDHSPSSNGYVHFYVIFSDQVAALAAIQVFNGRFFAGRKVNARFIEYEEYLSLQK